MAFSYLNIEVLFLCFFCGPEYFNAKTSFGHKSGDLSLSFFASVTVLLKAVYLEAFVGRVVPAIVVTPIDEPRFSNRNPSSSGYKTNKENEFSRNFHQWNSSKISASIFVSIPLWKISSCGDLGDWRTYDDRTSSSWLIRPCKNT